MLRARARTSLPQLRYLRERLIMNRDTVRAINICDELETIPVRPHRHWSISPFLTRQVSLGLPLGAPRSVPHNHRQRMRTDTVMRIIEVAGYKNAAIASHARREIRISASLTNRATAHARISQVWTSIYYEIYSVPYPYCAAPSAPFAMQSLMQGLAL